LEAPDDISKGGAGGDQAVMNTFNGMRVIESHLLVEDGEPCETWQPCGGGWKVRRIIVPKVSYRGAMQLDANTLVMHPAIVRELQKLAAPEGTTP
jgi:hypothetical protein